MSTHTLEVAEQIAGVVGVLKSGSLRFCGTLAELRSQTAAQGESLEEAFLRLTGDIYENRTNDKPPRGVAPKRDHS